MIGKYRPLTDYLRAATASGRRVVEMTFQACRAGRTFAGLPELFKLTAAERAAFMLEARHVWL